MCPQFIQPFTIVLLPTKPTNMLTGNEKNIKTSPSGPKKPKALAVCILAEMNITPLSTKRKTPKRIIVIRQVNR
ncbi:hypothetical protein PbDSM24746_11540 [Paenibacillus macerans]|nr:hypothetical protein PbDSM24746_11540 [Paenibacillus macerans]GBK67453.1 hypothetical protein PbJCM17693_11610 [Paenibacillus macerans]GIP09077.1 hypothetical protein J1TS5_12470 [Paenibacillus macerans]